MNGLRALLLASAVVSDVWSLAHAAWDRQAVPSVGEPGEGKPGGPIDGRGLWDRSLEAQRLPDCRLDGTLRTRTASGATTVLEIHLVGRLAEDHMSRMLLLRVVGAGPLGGSAFLTIEHQDAPHDGWVYLPALGGPRRLLSGYLAESLLGSEFRVGDLLQPNTDDYVVTLLGADRIGDDPCWIIEAVPRERSLERRNGLGRQVLWIGKRDFLERRIEQHDPAGELLKIMELGRWAALMEGRKWLPLERRIRNVQTGAWSSVVFEHVEAGVGIDAATFRPQHLADRTW
jgi:hypothetical protein